MRYSIAVACLLAAQSPSANNAFNMAPNFPKVDPRVHSASSHGRQEQQRVFPHGVSASFSAGEVTAGTGGGSGELHNDSLNVTSTSVYLTSLVSDAVQTDDDAEEIELAERQRKITQRSGSFRVTLPLRMPQDMAAVVTQPASLGLTIRQFYKGRDISNQILNLDTLVIETINTAEKAGVNGDSSKDTAVMETIEDSVMQDRLAPNFSGVYVSSILKLGPAWNAGIRPGDLLTSTGATLGSSLWPKTTLEGVQSAVSSRKMVS